MKYRYAQSSGGMYLRGDSAPTDSVEITEAEHAALLAGQLTGKRIVADASGKPVLADPPKATAAEVWERIKSERARRRFDGGVKVGENWFLSTQQAAGEYTALILVGSALPPGAVLRPAWRTMSQGVTVDMTAALAAQILGSGFQAIAAIDDAARAHRAAMEASADPAAYDYSTGWPAVFVG